MTELIFLQSSGVVSQNIILLGVAFAVMYFFMIRPQIKRQKKERQFQTNLKKGDKVVTTSGIHGKVLEINEKARTVVIDTGSAKIKFERSVISSELSKRKIEKENS